MSKSGIYANPTQVQYVTDVAAAQAANLSNAVGILAKIGMNMDNNASAEARTKLTNESAEKRAKWGITSAEKIAGMNNASKEAVAGIGAGATVRAAQIRAETAKTALAAQQKAREEALERQKKNLETLTKVDPVASKFVLGLSSDELGTKDGTIESIVPIKKSDPEYKQFYTEAKQKFITTSPQNKELYDKANAVYITPAMTETIKLASDLSALQDTTPELTAIKKRKLGLLQKDIISKEDKLLNNLFQNGYTNDQIEEYTANPNKIITDPVLATAIQFHRLGNMIRAGHERARSSRFFHTFSNAYDIQKETANKISSFLNEEKTKQVGVSVTKQKVNNGILKILNPMITKGKKIYTPSRVPLSPTESSTMAQGLMTKAITYVNKQFPNDPYARAMTLKNISAAISKIKIDADKRRQAARKAREANGDPKKLKSIRKKVEKGLRKSNAQIERDRKREIKRIEKAKKQSEKK